MKSRAAIGNHPIHPALVPLPIGAFFLLLVGDIAHASTGSDFWYQFGFACLSVGILAALAAAVFGFIDYFKVKMSMSGFRIARTHMILNLTGVVLYAFNWLPETQQRSSPHGPLEPGVRAGSGHVPRPRRFRVARRQARLRAQSRSRRERGSGGDRNRTA